MTVEEAKMGGKVENETAALAQALMEWRRLQQRRHSWRWLGTDTYRQMVTRHVGAVEWTHALLSVGPVGVHTSVK